MPRAIAALLCGAFLVTACAGAPAAAPAPTLAASPAPSSAADALPQRIVSLSPTSTEMLFAIGAGEQVVAVDDQSDFPAGVPVTDLSGFEPNLEAVAGYEPDLVVTSNDANDLVAGLERLGVPVVLTPSATTLEDSYAQIEQLGAATGHEEEAARVVAQMRREVEEITAQVPERAEPLTYYHELEPSLYTVTSATFIGQVYALAGLDNVADAADPDGEAGGYPQLSPEFLVEADPEVVFLADTVCCDQDAQALAARPGFDQLTAVREGRVVELDDDVASRWGPRVVEFLRTVVEATAEQPVGS